MAELRELKHDISELGRSLDGRTISFALRTKREEPRKKTASLATDLLFPTTVDGNFLGRNPSSRDYYGPIGGAPRRRPFCVQGSREHSSDGGSDYELDIWFPPAPPPRPPTSAAAAAVAVTGPTASCRRGVQADYGGVQNVDQLVRRVEASTRAVSRESEDVIRSLRMEEDKTARLRDALWQGGMAKRDWETTIEASRVLKKRLDSTERTRKRQKELIRELQAVEADIAFANAGDMARLFSQGPLPLPSPPLPLPLPPPLPPPQPPLSPRSLLTATVTKQKDVSSSQVTCPANCGTTAAGRRAESSCGARRLRLPSGDATAGAGTAAMRRQRGTGVWRGGGGHVGRRPRGAGTSAACSTPGRTAEKAPRRARVEHGQESASTLPRSSSRLEARQLAGQQLVKKRIRRRPALKATVTSAVARFGAPTAASSGKDRRRDGATAPHEQRSGATPREGGSRKSSPSFSSAKSSRHLVHSSLHGIASSCPGPRMPAARKIPSAAESGLRRVRPG
eukprot:g17202.t1